MSHIQTNNNSAVLVSAAGVSKKFCRSLKRSLWYGLQDITAEAVGHNPYHDQLRSGEFWAIRDVNFDVRRGECLALIGRNGAGKTTLLRLLNGLIKPDRGQITIRGRIGALIALGAGFNPILTGRENIYVNGSVLGLSRTDVDSKVEEIIDFAELREFIDTPVRNYSSGMNVRLGFAVASTLNPDILILDEVLAVGDFVFRMKCYERVNSLMNRAAVIFVSHQPDQVRRMCTRALYLRKGQPVYQGSVHEALRLYDEEDQSRLSRQDNYIDPSFVEASVTVSNHTVEFRGPLTVTLRCHARQQYSRLLIRVLFFSSVEEVAAEWISTNHHLRYDIPANQSLSIDIPIESMGIRPGQYRVGVVVAPEDNRYYLLNLKDAAQVSINGPGNMLHVRQL
ncbi:MAG: ABC transporter ATP-binding protein [Verrucomicrobiales bacterium]|nr:ABC transporter ATP-binding protein [Verrucomicrobiales bacterium]